MGSREVFRQLLEHLGDRIGFQFTLVDGHCSLIDTQSQTVIQIEVPEHSDLLLIYRYMTEWPEDSDLKFARALQLLALNGNPEQMQGACFFTDTDGTAIHLMASATIQQLTVDTLENFLVNFIELSNQLAYELTEELAEYPSRPDPHQGMTV